MRQICRFLPFFAQWDKVKILHAGDEELPTNQAMHRHKNTPTSEATSEKDKNRLIEVFFRRRKAFSKKWKWFHSYYLSNIAPDEDSANSVDKAWKGLTFKLKRFDFKVSCGKNISKYNTKSINIRHNEIKSNFRLSWSKNSTITNKAN